MQGVPASVLLAYANVSLDAFAAVVSVSLALYVLVSGRGRRDRVDAYFAGLCVAAGVMALGDATSWVFTPPMGVERQLIMLGGNYLFYLAAVPVFLFFTAYLVAFLGRGRRLPRAYLPLAAVLFGVYAVATTASLFNGMFFWVDEFGYHRGPAFWLSQAIPVGLQAANLVLLVHSRRALAPREFAAFASYVVLPALAQVVQMLNYGLALLCPAISLACLFVFMGIQSERKAVLAQRERELTEARADLMLSQIQPHFLYNTLAVIRELCREDSGAAVKAITDFSTYLRHNMASLSSKEPIPFARELSHARTYLALEQQRFGERLRVEYDIRATDFSLPPLTLQPLAENAVRHGVVQRPEGGTVRVVAFATGDGWAVEVRDDGVGFDPAAACQDDGSGAHVGLSNVRTRLGELPGAALTVESAVGRGTVARIAVPRPTAGPEG